LTGRAAGRPVLSTRLTLALGAAVLIIGGSPLAGALREALLTRWPAGYVPALAACVIVAALTILMLSVRAALRPAVNAPAQWSGSKLTAIALAFALALGVGYLERTGDPNVDVVEAFHFVEYSALTCLFAWALAPLVPGHAWVWAAAASVAVGAFDEWMQWFVPNRTGEIRDVGIDAVATVCGVLLATALEIGGRPERRRLVRPMAFAAAGTLLAVAVCFGVIHLGAMVEDAEAGRFDTRYNGPTLIALGRERASRWGRGPIAPQTLFAREDQYLAEALWNIRRRNKALDASDTVTAWREERILERYYAPILQVDTSGRPQGHALSPEQLAAIAPGRAGAAAGASDASPIPIVTWSRGRFWAVVAGAIGGLAVVGIVSGPGRI
jgi:VanZ family protein